LNIPDTEISSEHQREAAAVSGKENPITRLARIVTRAARFHGDAHGLDTGERVALARMDPDDMRPHQVAALARALIYAGLEPESWRPETWRRWALIAHGMALAGHDRSRGLGQGLSEAGVSESRVTRLLTARGDAFRQLLPRLLRLLANKNVSPNWHELGGLILHQDRRDPEGADKAEALRLKIAGQYFAAEARKPKH
jgi:CRISPR system Cascade subunit CasB